MNKHPNNHVTILNEKMLSREFNHQIYIIPGSDAMEKYDRSNPHANFE